MGNGDSASIGASTPPFCSVSSVRTSATAALSVVSPVTAFAVAVSVPTATAAAAGSSRW